MNEWSALAVLVAGAGAGLVNAMVGSGTLLTFPTLLAIGVPPISANISNNLGLLGGGVSGAWGYRHELHGDGPLLRRLAPASAIGAGLGASAVLAAPARVFTAVVPVLITVALILVMIQPRLAARLGQARADKSSALESSAPPEQSLPKWLPPSVAGAGIYGGYFGAAQGVLLIGLLGLAIPDDLQRVNGVKNVLSLTVNLVAAAVFLLVRPSAVQWVVVLLIAVGSWAGGFLGARWGRRLSPQALRTVVVAVGVIAVVQLVARNL